MFNVFNIFNFFKRKSKAQPIGKIVASIVRMRGELAQAITDNQDDIISSQSAINEASEVKEEEIKIINSKFNKVEKSETENQTVANDNIKEAKAWLEELPSRAK